jgi:hypothetical protein
MDDFEFAALSRAEAEEVLFAWDAALGTYDLVLNPTKTHIFDGPLSPEARWKVQLKHFTVREDTDRKYANDIRSLFALAFHLARENPTKYVLKYALRRAGQPTQPLSWGVYSDLALAVAVAEPSALEAAHDAFIQARADSLPLDNDSIAETLNELCTYHAPLEHGYEVVWSLYTLRELGLKVSSDAAARVAQMRDNTCLLLLLEANANRMIEGGAPNLSTAINRAEDLNAWHSEDWLLAYEAGRNGWANPSALKKEAAWAELLKLGVAFFLPPTAMPTGKAAKKVKIKKTKGTAAKKAAKARAAKKAVRIKKTKGTAARKAAKIPHTRKTAAGSAYVPRVRGGTGYDGDDDGGDDEYE